MGRVTRAPWQRWRVGILLGVAACAVERGAEAGEAAPPGFPEVWRVDPAPTVEIGTEDAGGAYRFDRIVGLVRLTTGAIVVADGGSSEVRGFTADGRHSWTVGKKGDGPGDFARVAAMALDGPDTMIVYDNRAPSRYTWVGPGGTIVGSRSVSLGTRCGPPVLGLARGRVAVADCRRDPLPEGRHRPAQFLVVGDLRSSATSRVAEVPGGEIEILPGGSWRGVALGVSPTLAARGSLIAYGTGERYEVQLFGVDGTRLPSIRMNAPRRAVTGADRKAYMDRLTRRLEAFARARGRSSAALVEGGGGVRTPPFADSLPAFGALRIDADENIWVGEYRPGGEPPERWRVFRRTGEPLAELAVPTGFAIFEIGHHEVLGVRRDADDVERVMAFRLVRGTRPGAARSQGSSRWRLGAAVAVDSTSPYLTPGVRAVPGPAGGVLVFGVDTPVVVHYDQAGTLVRMIGRQGEGPGEFRRIGDVGWLADTLWVRDDGLRRFTYFSPKGGLLRTVVPPWFSPRDSRATVFVVRSPLPGERWLVFGAMPPSAGTEIRATGLSVLTTRPSGAGSDPLFTGLPAPLAPIRIVVGNGATVSVVQPWAGGDIVAVAPDGRRVVRIRRPPAKSRARAAYTVSMVSVDGSRLFETSVPFSPQPITEKMVVNWLEGFEDPALIRAFGSKHRLVAMLRDSLYRPSFAPPRLAVAFGSGGMTVITRDSDSRMSECDLIDSTGRLLGSLSLPTGATVLAGSAGAVWLVREVSQAGEATTVLERRPVLR